MDRIIVEKKSTRSVVLFLLFLLTPACDDDRDTSGGFIVGLRSDGAIDTGFGEAGWVFVNPTEGDLQVHAADIDGQDQIAVGGCLSSSTGGSDNAALLFSEIGTAARSFGTDGLYRSRAPLRCAHGLAVNRINNALVTDYYLLSADFTTLPSSHRRRTSFVLQRLDSRGRPDRGFGGDGTAEIVFEPGLWDSDDCPWSDGCLIDHDMLPGAVAVDSDGRPVVLGTIEMADVEASRFVRDQVVARFLPNGNIDMTFGEDGKLIQDWGLVEQGTQDLAVDEAGAIAITASAPVAGAWPRVTPGIGVLRITELGQPDPSFGVGGMAFDNFDDSSARVSRWPLGVEFDDRGGIIVSGLARIERSGRASQDRLIVLRFEGRRLDPAFGSEGVAWISFPGFEINLNRRRSGLAIDESGRIVVAVAGREGNRVFVARLDRTGTLDRSFGTGGRVVLSVPGGGAQRSTVLLGDGGSIFIAGDTRAGP